MCRKLGKKHWQYISSEAVRFDDPQEEAKYNKDRLGRPVKNLYRVKLLLEHTFLRDVYWNPQCNHRSGIGARLTPAKQKHYDKLDRYFDRTTDGRK